MNEEEIKDVINYVESICNGTYSTEEEGFEIKKYIEQLQQENKEQQNILNEFIEYINKNPKVLQNPFFLDMRIKILKK